MNAEYVNDLVKQLRKPSSAIHKVTQKGVEWTVSTDIDAERAEAADALEAKAKRIAELEADNESFLEQLALRSESVMHKDMQEIMRINNQLNSRIAELEAENSDLKDQLKESYDDGYTQGYDTGYYAGADFYDR